jgi:hypothetical protein
MYKQGDRVGVLLDLDCGSLCFFKNGVKHGPGFAPGSGTGPVTAAVRFETPRSWQRQSQTPEGCTAGPRTAVWSARILPNAKVPVCGN